MTVTPSKSGSRCGKSNIRLVNTGQQPAHTSNLTTNQQIQQPLCQIDATSQHRQVQTDSKQLLLNPTPEASKLGNNLTVPNESRTSSISSHAKTPIDPSTISSSSQLPTSKSILVNAAKSASDCCITGYESLPTFETDSTLTDASRQRGPTFIPPGCDFDVITENVIAPNNFRDSLPLSRWQYNKPDIKNDYFFHQSRGAYFFPTPINAGSAQMKKSLLYTHSTKFKKIGAPQFFEIPVKDYLAVYSQDYIKLLESNKELDAEMMLAAMKLVRKKTRMS